MLATQDPYALGTSQLAFEERSDEGAEEAAEVKRLIHQADLLLLRAAGAAARFATTRYYDNHGYTTAIDWKRRARARRASSTTSAITTGMPPPAKALRLSRPSRWRTAGSGSASAKTAPCC